MSDVLILGETGQLAVSLRGLDWPAGLKPIFFGRRALGDALQAGAAAAAAIRATRPVLVLNAAAYTAVDKAEREPELAHALNAELPLAATRACGDMDIPSVHISTDYVFDGNKVAAYTEQDVPNPLSVYGASKLAGERNIERTEGAFRTILRTSWLFSEADGSFPARLLKRGLSGEPLRVVDDQTGCPTPAGALASVMQAVGLRLLDRDLTMVGRFHYRGAQAMSWHGFAAKLVDAAVAAGIKRPALQAIASAEFPTAAKRPRNSVLDCGAIMRQGIEPAEIDGDIDRVVRAILAR